MVMKKRTENSVKLLIFMEDGPFKILFFKFVSTDFRHCYSNRKAEVWSLNLCQIEGKVI